jgi:hypothetical protein
MLAELVCRGGINNASLKRAFENRETREPAQGGDVDVSEQTF